MARDRGVSIAAAVNASGTDPQNVESYSYTTGKDATVEQVDVRIYPGAGLALRLEILHVDDQTGTESPLVRTRGKDYIDGDDDTYSFNISEPIKQDDEIKVRATNLADSEEYNFRVNFDVDERAGTRSLLGEVLNG
jgi:hypothetical protein